MMQRKQNWRERSFTIVLLVILLIIFDLATQRAQSKSPARPDEQAFDVAATVTALIATRDTILAIVTQTPGIAGISDGSTGLNAQARVEVVVNGLNVRGGPGTNYPIINTANRGETFYIIGQASNCNWLQISDDGGSATTAIGWISGAPQYVRFPNDCVSIPRAAIPATPVPPPTATPRPATSVNDAGQGCYLIRNELGFAVTITLTSVGGWNDTFQLAIGAEREYCAPAGTYDYRLTAPAPLGSIQGTLTVNAGERMLLPLKFGN